MVIAISLAFALIGVIIFISGGIFTFLIKEIIDRRKEDEERTRNKNTN